MNRGITSHDNCNDDYIAKKYYKDLKACLLGLKAKSPDNLWHDGFGDWCHPNTEYTWQSYNSAVDVVNSCLYYKIACQMADIAELNKKPDDKKLFAELAADIQAAFIKEYVKADGIIKMRLKKHEAGSELKLTVPPNTSAEVYIPYKGEDFTLYDGETVIKNVGRYERCGDYIKLTLGSGNYDLRAINNAYRYENTPESTQKARWQTLSAT